MNATHSVQVTRCIIRQGCTVIQHTCTERRGAVRLGGGEGERGGGGRGRQQAKQAGRDNGQIHPTAVPMSGPAARAPV